MKETLNYLFSGNVLTQNQARETLTGLASGNYTNEEMASFLTVYMMRKITPAEILGFRDAMLNLAVPVDLGGCPAIDVCGTGGDGKNTFNVSTLSAFVIAGTGAKVAKHGNYGLSSPCGSSNIFEYFGYQFSTDSGKLRKELDESGVCYFHAPMFHPAMKNIAPVRKALKVKTFFNMLGPMTNPARPQQQFVGVFSDEVQKLYAEVYQLTDIRHNIIYCSQGYDEISLTGNFCVMGNGKTAVYSPEMIGCSTISPAELHGGNTIEEAANIFMTILEGRGSKAQNDVVVANAAFALTCVHPEKTIDECLSDARESLTGGKALKAFKKLFNR